MLLRAQGAKCFLDAHNADVQSAVSLPLFQHASDVDLLAVLGGDGTLLRVVREHLPFSTPILAVHKGNVGFLAEVGYNDFEQAVRDIQSGCIERDERSLLRATLCRNDVCTDLGIVLNDVVIGQGALARLVDLRVGVDGLPLTHVRSDGLIFATPTGSTAYSLAAGGPIVHPRLRAIIMTPINPHSFTQKPLVLPSEVTIEVDIVHRSDTHLPEVALTLDGQVSHPLLRHDRIRITTAPHTVTFLRRPQETFLPALREKLKWGNS